MLGTKIFKTVIENAPLVSIDLCIVCDGQVLLGKRTNEPLKGKWFTPGGRIHKNETWQVALQRIALTELGLPPDDCVHFELMGVWDHFYPNSVCDKSVSTHYVNLPHFSRFKYKPAISGDDQHDSWSWFDLEKIGNDEGFHEYVQNYARCLINKDT